MWFERFRGLSRPVLVDVRHGDPAAIEHFGQPDDEASYDAARVPSLLRDPLRVLALMSAVQPEQVTRVVRRRLRVRVMLAHSVA